MRKLSTAIAVLACCMVWGMVSADVIPPDPADDVASGEAVYQRCIACHSLERNRTGPLHCGLFGRKAGAVRGYDYSRAMAGSEIVWDETTLNAFLTSPLEFIPGTTMGFAGIADAADRQALIAYLQFADRELCNDYSF